MLARDIFARHHLMLPSGQIAAGLINELICTPSGSVTVNSLQFDTSPCEHGKPTRTKFAPCCKLVRCRIIGFIGQLSSG